MRFVLLLPLLLCTASAESPAFPRVIETAPRVENGMACYESFLWHRFESRSTPTVAGARALCADYARNAMALGRKRPWTMMGLKDIGRFFAALRAQYDKTPIAKSFSFFAEAANFCYVVNFKAYQLSANGEFGYSNMELKFRSSYSVECPVNEPDASVTHVACTAVNCTRLPTPAPTLGRTEAPVDRLGPDRSRSRPCLLLGEDAVSMTDFREARLTYIIALVGCNLLSFAFLAAAIHYCLKWRHLRRLYRLARGPGSLAGTASSPPAVRHLGTTSSVNGSGAIGSVSLPPYGGAYPDYHYSSIARRKALHQQHQPRPDDDMLSYRSDHTQLLLKGSIGGTLQRQAAPPTTLRHGAISPPRGWGNSEPPSTPGSMRRNGSISQMSMTSQGMPRRNGSLPAPPHPPPPPPINGY